ncbi:hypothetical protein ACR42D_06685 [Desulfovibrio caledoniensis]
MNNAKLFRQLKKDCHDLLSEDVSIKEFQWKIRLIESAMTSFDDRKNRDFFTGIEGELELIIYTVESKLQQRESNKIVNKVLRWLDTMGL